MAKSKTYGIRVDCTNCEAESTAQIEMGTPVPTKIKCPNCGCKTASKMSKPIRTENILPRHERDWFPRPLLIVKNMPVKMNPPTCTPKPIWSMQSRR